MEKKLLRYHIVVFNKDISKNIKIGLDDLIDSVNKICQDNKGIETISLPDTFFSERGGDEYKRVTHYLVGNSLVKNGIDMVTRKIVTHVFYLESNENEGLIKDFIKFYKEEHPRKTIRSIY